MDSPFPVDMISCIEAFLSVDADRPGGKPIYDEVFETSNFFPLQRQQELIRMLAIAGSIKPKVVYEIGADKGGGLYHWCKCLPTVERVIACEVRGTPYAEAFENAFKQLDFLWLPKSSYADKAVKQVETWLKGDKIDVLFIDGDKGQFLLDFEVYYELMNPNGIVFMHDIQDEIPGSAFLEVATRFRTDRIIDLTDTELAIRREAAGVPPTGPHEGWLRHWKGKSAGVGVVYLGEKLQ